MKERDHKTTIKKNKKRESNEDRKIMETTNHKKDKITAMTIKKKEK